MMMPTWFRARSGSTGDRAPYSGYSWACQRGRLVRPPRIHQVFTPRTLEVHRPCHPPLRSGPVKFGGGPHRVVVSWRSKLKLATTFVKRDAPSMGFAPDEIGLPGIDRLTASNGHSLSALGANRAPASLPPESAKKTRSATSSYRCNALSTRRPTKPNGMLGRSSKALRPRRTASSSSPAKRPRDWSRDHRGGKSRGKPQSQWRIQGSP